MSVNPQYTYDNEGNPVGVFLPINEWNQIAEELQMDIPDWQKALIDQRLKEYQNDPSAMEDADSFLASLDKEDLK